MKIRTLEVDVYRYPFGDCTNKGVSGRFRTLEIACDDGNNVFDSDIAIPINFCMIKCRKIHNIFSHEEWEYLDIVPATVNEYGEVVERSGRWMYGGNVAESSDSRFRWMTAGYPLRIRDRRE